MISDIIHRIEEPFGRISELDDNAAEILNNAGFTKTLNVSVTAILWATSYDLTTQEETETYMIAYRDVNNSWFVVPPNNFRHMAYEWVKNQPVGRRERLKASTLDWKRHEQICLQ